VTHDQHMYWNELLAGVFIGVGFVAYDAGFHDWAPLFWIKGGLNVIAAMIEAFAPRDDARKAAKVFE
jgi:hypothetical protein